MRIQILSEGGGIGDMMMRFGVIRSIKQAIPDAKVWLVVLNKLAEWAGLERAIDQRVSVSESTRRSISALPDPRKYSYLEEGAPFDETIDTYDPAGGYENKAFGPITRGRAALWRATAEAVLGLKLQPQLGKLSVPPVETELAIAKLLVRLGERPRFLVGIHPCAHWAWRSLDLTQTRQIVQELQAVGAQCLLFHHVHAPIADWAKELGAIAIIGETPAALVRIVKLCDAMITVDSGFFHLAGTLGVPTVGLFGQTDGQVTGEEYSSCRWITAGPIEREGLLCEYPCYRRSAAGCVKKLCSRGCRALRRISATAAVDKLLKLVIELKGGHLPEVERERRQVYQRGFARG